jgi:hypothetical protein
MQIVRYSSNGLIPRSLIFLKIGSMPVRHASHVNRVILEGCLLNRDLHAWRATGSETARKNRQMGTNVLGPSHGVTFGLPSTCQQTHFSGLNDQVLTFYHDGRPSQIIFNVAGFTLSDGQAIRFACSVVLYWILSRFGSAYRAGS